MTVSEKNEIMLMLKQIKDELRKEIFSEANSRFEGHADNKDAVVSVFVNASEKGELTGEQMYKHTDFYGIWSGDADYKTGNIVTDPQYKDGNYLFQARQDHTSQDIYPPHLVPALWMRIPRPDEGTHDNPIEYDASVGMELIEGKFYLEDEVLYVCTRNSGTPIYNRLADLINIYVQVSNE